jgi:hypothetical protein
MRFSVSLVFLLSGEIDAFRREAAFGGAFQPDYAFDQAFALPRWAQNDPLRAMADLTGEPVRKRE